MTTDFRSLCAELVEQLSALTQTRLQKQRGVVTRARAALAEPEPPADWEVAELVEDLETMANYADAACQFGDAQSLSRAADLLSRLMPQPVTEGPSDVELDALLQAIFAQRLYQGVPRTTLENDFARAVLARWGTSDLTQVRSSLGDGPLLQSGEEEA